MKPIKKVQYYWLMEVRDNHGTPFIVETADSVEVAKKTYQVMAFDSKAQIDVALVRIVAYIDSRGIHEKMRNYAYFDKKGRLPKEFYKGKKVPEKYRSIKLNDIAH